jgi:hypothetical protein
MDNKTIFVRTSKGEDEVHSRTTHLPGDIKRALLMVDGNATIDEIRKRAAPSLRSSLDEMFEELEKGGYIRDKGQGNAKSQDKARDKARHDNIPKMSVPVKMATPQKSKLVEEGAGELDFMSGFAASDAAVAAAEMEAAEAAAEGAAAEDAAAAEAALAQRLKAEAEEKSRREIEAAKLNAQREAEAILHKAEQEAARIREETVRHAKAEAEATRIKAEQEAKRVRDELAAAKLKTEQETRLRLEAAARVKQQAEAARLKAEQEAAQMRIELEEARIRAELEAKVRLEASAKAHARMQAEDEAAKARERDEAERIAKQEQEAAKAREEAERIAKQEQEAAKAREEAERIKYEQRVREETERIIKQEQEAKAREAVASEQAARTTEAAPAEKPSAFTFDSFQVDKPLYTSESQVEKQPAQKASPAETAPVTKPGGFAFDSFKVDEPPPPPVEPQRNKPPVQQASTAQQPSAAKATLPVEVPQPVKQQPVPPPAVSKAADSQPSQEHIQRAMQERKAVEERMAAEALEAKKLAEAQDKSHAEAQQRMIEAARDESEQAARQSVFTVADAPAAKPAPVARVSRKPFPWGRLVGFVFKLGLFLLVLLVGALFIVPIVMPMRDYMPKAEQLLSEKLHQPVHIGKLSGRILPMPRLELGEIYIGDAKQFQADDAQINFALTGLFTEVKPVSSLEFQGVKVRGAWVRNVSEWLQQMANEEKYPVSRMVISQGKLDADVFELTGIEGELDFDPAGKFTQTNLRADSGKYALGLQVTPEDKLQASITVRGSALPLLPNWMFDDLTAKGELSKDELAISDFDARIFGGTLQGSATINWRSGWRAQGALTAKTITMQNFNKLLEGNIEGSARFKMTSLDLGGLPDSVSLEGSFTSSDGTIGGLEIVETARNRSKENLPGGRTHYDGLAGVVSYASGVYHFKQTKVSGSALTATATFDVDAAKQQLSGKMKVNLSLPDTGGTVDLQIGGVADSPTLRYAP